MAWLGPDRVKKRCNNSETHGWHTWLGYDEQSFASEPVTYMCDGYCKPKHKREV